MLLYFLGSLATLQASLSAGSSRTECLPFFKNFDAVSAFGGKFCRCFISPGDSGRCWDQTCDLRMIRRVFCCRALSSLAIVVICPIRHLSCGSYYKHMIISDARAINTVKDASRNVMIPLGA